MTQANDELRWRDMTLPQRVVAAAASVVIVALAVLMLALIVAGGARLVAWIWPG